MNVPFMIKTEKNWAVMIPNNFILANKFLLVQQSFYNL